MIVLASTTRLLELIGEQQQVDHRIDDVLRRKIVLRRSVRTSRSKTKFNPDMRDSTFENLGTGASLNSIVTSCARRP